MNADRAKAIYGEMNWGYERTRIELISLRDTNVILTARVSILISKFLLHMDRDVFILSVENDAEPAGAIRRALENTGVIPSRIQDAVFGYDGAIPPLNVQRITQMAGLTCPAVNVSSSLRAVIFGAQAILSGDLELVFVIGLAEDGSAALLLASPDAVGRYNLLPRGRIAGRSLSGTDTTLKAAGLASNDVTVTKVGERGVVLVKEALEELEQRQAQWGLVSMEQIALLIERI